MRRQIPAIVMLLGCGLWLVSELARNYGEHDGLGRAVAARDALARRAPDLARALRQPPAPSVDLGRLLLFEAGHRPDAVEPIQGDMRRQFRITFSRLSVARLGEYLDHINRLQPSLVLTSLTMNPGGETSAEEWSWVLTVSGRAE